MASENRFDGLMSGLNSAGADEKPVEKAAKKPRKRQAAKQKPAVEVDDFVPTRRAEGEPKMPRNRYGEGGKITLAKSKNPDYEKGTYYLPKELTHEMRVFATINRMEMSELVDKAMRAYLKDNPFKNP